MITRKQYMENSSELFNEYYAQFITEATEQFILNNIGMKKLEASKCENLNDVDKMSNGSNNTWIWDSTPINNSLLKDAGENSSLSTHTCVGKVCAKKLLTNDK